MSEDSELRAKRASAVYESTKNWLGHTTDLSDEEIDRRALEAVEVSVYGHDAVKRNGKYVPQGLGSPGHETGNHFAAIRRYEGQVAWENAVRELQKRDPARHAKLGLPHLPPRT